MTGVLRQVQNVFAQQGASRLVAIDTEAGTITLKEGAFRRGSACVEPEARAAFAQVEQRIADYLKQNPAGRIYVEGHTDDNPLKFSHFKSNWELSGARAANVISIFENAGFPPENLVAIGYGASRPIAPNRMSDGERNLEGQRRNRRVVVTIYKEDLREPASSK